MPIAIDPARVPIPPAASALKRKRNPEAWILTGLAGFCLAGAAFAFWLRTVPAGIQDPRLWYNAFFVLFSRDEPIGLLLVASFSIGAVFMLSGKDRGPLENAFTLRLPLLLLPLALAVLIIAGAGTWLVCHNYGLSADENMADFQAKIFLHGKISAEIPPQWIPVVRLIKPTFVDYFPDKHSWKSAYLPVYAALRAIFQYAGLQCLLNPLLAAITIIAVFGTIRNIWPDKPDHAFIAAALLATSSQFLVMAMTAYSMPAHLAFNSVWLWLYSRPDRRRFYLAPIVGVLAIGLHQLNVHALFVAPFLFRLVRQRKWLTSTVFFIIYAIGCAGWMVWNAHYLRPEHANALNYLRLFNPRMLIIQPMNLLLLIGWSSLALPFLVILGFSRLSGERAIIQDAAASCLLTFGFYFFFYLDQGHGWGYRYFHPALASLVIVGVVGWEQLQRSVGASSARRFLALSLVASAFVQLPLRCYQTEAFVRPFAVAREQLQNSPADVVGINPSNAWYSADLIRNDPFLRDRPILAAAMPLSKLEADTLMKAGETHFLSQKEMRSFGLSTVRLNNMAHDPFQLGMAPKRPISAQ